MVARLNKVDSRNGATVAIESLHHMNHEGFVYHSSGKVTGMVDTNVDDFLIVTAAGNFPHIQHLNFAFGGGDVDIQIYEGTTASANGTSLPIYNTNRNSSNTPDLVFYTAPTITDVGTLIHTGWAPPTATGIGANVTGIVTDSTGEEWILKPSEKYLVRVTNNSGATIDYRYELLFYEIGY